MRKTQINKFFLVVTAVLALALLPLAAQANLITNPNFSSLIPGTFSMTPTPNYQEWLEATPTSWSAAGGVASSSGGTDWLILGCPMPANPNISAGWMVKLSFDYQSTTGLGSAELAGFDATGTWNPGTNGVTGGTILTTFTGLSATTGNEWKTFQGSFSLGSVPVALGVGFQALPAVKNVDLEIVAPVSFRITPTTLNLKSNGNFVTGFISNPPAGYTLADINQSTVQLNYNGELVGTGSINAKGKKFMIKFSRSDLVTALNGATGSITLTVTGSFTDQSQTMFEGTTTINVINPGKKHKK